MIMCTLADTAAMTLHLAEISSQVAPGAHAVVVLDGAGWHRPAGRLRLPDNISLLHLPPYSPELNPVENIWHDSQNNEAEDQQAEHSHAAHHPVHAGRHSIVHH